MFKKISSALILLLLSSTLFAQEPGNWFNDILKTNSSDPANWSKNRSATWADLRARYKDSAAMQQMSWEERDKIWTAELGGDIYKSLAGRYRSAYQVSCKERGITPVVMDTVVNDLTSVLKLRDIYLASRKAEYVVLTPKTGKLPKINSAEVFGVRPGNELIYRIPASGERPMKFWIKGLPAGCKFNDADGVLSGAISKAGKYILQITAQNKYGKAQKNFTLIVGQTIALTPPMGWNSWNSFACDVTAQDIKNSADQLINTGLANFGWNSVNIDDCWMKRPDFDSMPDGKEKEMRKEYFLKRQPARVKSKKVRFNEAEVIGQVRSENGTILSNKDFTDMKSLTNYIHN